MSLRTVILRIVACSAVLGTITAGAEEVFPDIVDETGVISLPTDFRANMQHLGSWFVPEGDASGFHDVYTDPATITTYRKTGKFPDGAVLVKELRGATAGDYTTGKNVKFATSGIKQWFVMVKDSENRFPDNPSWGEGWGWALFRPDNPSVNVSGNYGEDCLGCHLPARATDLVYVEAYPTLK